MLTFESVHKSFGSTPALSEVSVRVDRGTVVGLVGHNGAGKSTLMKMALGLVRPDSGEVTIAGTPVPQIGRFGGLIAASFDASALPATWTAATMLSVAGELSGTPISRVPQMLEQVGLSAVAGKKIGQFSSGMRQRLALAVALVSDPQVLILDEPTNALDPVISHELRGWVTQHAARGGSVLISSHNLQEVEQVADRIVVMHKGHVARDAAIGELLDANSVLVRVDQPAALTQALDQLGRRVTPLPGGTLRVQAATTDEVGEIAAAQGLVVRELSAERNQLSDIYQLITAEGPAQ
ncbi:ABC transporter ATP-binding protein [Dactylosporangium sp. NPDC051485]|uniref:ABC transporter ATP-binding protein n=1 Tax=Dactylosporangium sp. NPDC051485 TaxID=3154846 RepID=UPI0034411A97